MEKRLMGKRIVVMVANGFDERDFSTTQRLLASQGAMPKIVSPENGLVNSWRAEDGKEGWGHHFPVDAAISTVLAADYDGLLIVGGHRSIDKLKENAHARRIMRGFMDATKPVLLLGAAVEMLANAERAKGYTVAALESLEKTMVDAGATYTGDTMAQDDHLMTAVSVLDDEAFVEACVTLFTMSPSYDDEMKQAA